MNQISHNGQAYDFTTVSELLATPLTSRFLADPLFKHFGYADKCLVAFDSQPVCHTVGRVKNPIVLPKTLQVIAA